MRAVRLSVALVFAASALFANAAAIAADTGGGPVETDVSDDDRAIEAVHSSMIEAAAELGLTVARNEQAAATLFQYPLRMSTHAGGLAGEYISNHVDHDPGSGVEDFACGTRTYDGHGGVDLALYPYRWTMMDNREMAVVAALGGTIVKTHDGEQDRNCSLVDAEANSVVILHDNGLLGYYWHLKRGTVTNRPPGSRVSAGTVLGYVGSSGRSTAPHLHFQVRDADGVTVDPWHGLCNALPTAWAHQSATVDTQVLRVATHRIQPPAPSNGCDDPDPGFADHFNRGEQLWAAVYLRDQTPSAAALLQIVRPDGSIAASWTSGTPSTGFYRAAYYWAAYTVPTTAPKGIWQVRATLDGRVHAHSFRVGGALRGTKMVAEITSRRHRKVRIGRRARFFAVLSNVGGRKAVGCQVSAGRPVDASFVFHEIDPVTNAPIAGAGENLTVPVGESRHIRLTLVPNSGFDATRAQVPLQFKCTNSKAVRFSRGKTMITLTKR